MLPNLRFSADLVAFTEEILNRKLHFLCSESKKNVWTNLSYIQHFLIICFTILGCVSISAFASLVGIPIGITSSVIGLKICVITAAIKKYNSITQN